MGVALTRACRCGHGKDAHSHYRRGSDCSGCACVQYAGGFALTVSLRTAPPARVVVPDVIPVAPEPYVRPTHAAGPAGPPRPEVVPPRVGDQPVPEPRQQAKA